MVKARIDLFRSTLLSSKFAGLDSMCFLYHFADHHQYAYLTQIIFELLEQKKVKAVTSFVTIIEVFIQAERVNDQYLIGEYEKFFQGVPNLDITSVDWQVSRLAAKLRAYYQFLKTPDAIQLSSCLLAKCRLFITNDKKLKKVKEIKTILLNEYL